MRASRRIALILAALATAVTVVATTAPVADARPRADVVAIPELRRTAMVGEMLSWINAERAARGLPVVSITTDTASQANADTVARAGGCFHPDVANRGSALTWQGEVIACGGWTAEVALRGLMQSTGHRDLLLDPDLTHVAIGLACQSPGPYATWAVNLYAAGPVSSYSSPSTPAAPIVTPPDTGLLCDGSGRLVPASLPSSGQGFTPSALTRVLDTRRTGRMAPDGTVDIDLSGLVPAGTTAVALSLAAVQPASPGHLRVHAADTARPNVSSLNYAPGEFARAGFVVTPVSADRRVRLYTSAGTDVVADLTGFASPGGAGVATVGATPRRILDTRNGGGPLVADVARTIDVNDAGIPTDATGVFVTVTSTGAAAGTSGHITAWPAGTSRPTTSVVNVIGGLDVANMAYLPLSADGRISLVAGSTTTHVVLDVAAYTAPSATGRFVPITPERVVDTRGGSPYPTTTDSRPPVGPIAATSPVVVRSVPANALAVFAGVTSSQPTGAGWMSATGIGQPAGTTSVLNVVAGRDIAGFAVVPVAGGGIQTVSSAVGQHLIDVFGYLVSP